MSLSGGFRDMKNLYQNLRPELVGLIPLNYSKVLEIGCGTGKFRLNLNRDCEYWGIEPFKEAARIASDSLHRVLEGTYEDVYEQLPDNYFDLVICNDVIEHMPDHDFFLSSIKNKIKVDSYIIGSVPNIRCIYSLWELLMKKDWLYMDEGIFDRTHLRFFTYKSLERIFVENNYIVDKLYGVNRVTIKLNTIKNIFKTFLMYVIGRDSEFIQFGFRLKYS